MENALWIQWRALRSPAFEMGIDRVYFGHETCERLLPIFSDVSDLAKALMESGVGGTLVTPFLTDSGLARSQALVERLCQVLPDLEVVCNDWGLLNWIASERIATPVVGRVLAAQPSDPRILRMVQSPDGDSGCKIPTALHMDGTLCQVRRKPVSPELLLHYQSCWVDKEPLLSFLQSLGVRRCEISNVPQGLSLSGSPGWSYSLCVPDVLVSVMRACPGHGEDFESTTPCKNGGNDCSDRLWTLPALRGGIHRQGNALYFEWDRLPANLSDLPVDRLVRRQGFAVPDPRGA